MGERLNSKKEPTPMKKLTQEAYEYIDQVVGKVVGKSGVKGFSLFEDGDNPFSFFLEIPLENGEELAVRTCNDLFHALELLPEGKNLALGELGDYCEIVPPERNGLYLAVFNHPAVRELKETDPESRFILKNWRDWDVDDEDNLWMQETLDGIKAGRLKSKSPDGYLVLKARYYDEIEAGTKKVEYRDFTEYNLKRTIGIKTVRFNRGYVKNAPQMRWEVEKIVLLDADDNECDPFNVPEDFWPATIAIHLGKRIG